MAKRERSPAERSGCYLLSFAALYLRSICAFKMQKISSPSWTDAVFFGWLLKRRPPGHEFGLNGILTLMSGTPLTIGANGNSLNTPGNNQTADQVKADVQNPAWDQYRNPWFDPTAFAQPTAPGVFGNSGRNIFDGPGFFNLGFYLQSDFDGNPRPWHSPRPVISMRGLFAPHESGARPCRVFA
ncbi:MAG TPA: hypothetical protein VKB79_04135 [Bryobacteraceae bacterium]|nr:hypothetical protein [Bryobacteraceae bacterium]